jgi:peptide/nickel transport system ATP-binding protein
MSKREKVLSVKDLEVQFTLRGHHLMAIRGCSLDLYDGETLAIVGESGSGKSVFTKCFVGMLDKNGAITGGSIHYQGQDLVHFRSEAQWRTIRGKEIAMVMQDPMTSLNPLKRIGVQIQEAVELHQNLSGAAAKKETIRMLELVGIPEPERRYYQYPHEFSGGMRQRVVIATAIACRPKILICDEPTTALDVTIQAQILDLIRQLQKEFGMTIIYITHDLGVVANVAERVAVMYAGQIIEIGMAEEIFYNSQHPYTWALLGALPQLGTRGNKLPAIDGAPPNLFNKITGDAFAPRNRKALKIDFVEEPPMFSISDTHWVKSWNMDPRAPEVEQPAEVKRLAECMLEKRNAQAPEPENYEGREKLIEVENLYVGFGSVRKRFMAVKGVSFDIYRGETFALVGESGSGKTTIGRAILRINPATAGEIRYRGRRISGKIDKGLDLEVIRGCQMIFQDPMASLNERAKVDYIVAEGLLNHKLYENEEDRQRKVHDVLTEVGLLPEFASRFPHEFSGGQRQRIGIARALVMEPEFIVADEPISALDVSIRAQVLNLLDDLQKKRGLTYLFIAHDLSVVRFVSDRIAVINRGQIVELAQSEELFCHPMHPYTQALLSAVPNPDPKLEKEKKLLIYDPSVHQYRKNPPGWQKIRPGHYVLANEPEMDAYRKRLQQKKVNHL